jgi:peptide/nickel transport system permease protein
LYALVDPRLRPNGGHRNSADTTVNKEGEA